MVAKSGPGRFHGSPVEPGDPLLERKGSSQGSGEGDRVEATKRRARFGGSAVRFGLALPLWKRSATRCRGSDSLVRTSRRPGLCPGSQQTRRNPRARNRYNGKPGKSSRVVSKSGRARLSPRTAQSRAPLHDGKWRPPGHHRSPRGRLACAAASPETHRYQSWIAAGRFPLR